METMTLTFLRKNSSKKRSLAEPKIKETMTRENPDKTSHRPPAILSDLKECSVIGTAETSCPCCRQNLTDQRQIVGETRMQSVYTSLFNDDGSETESCNSFDDMDEDGSMMPGVLSGGTPYVITKHIVQGWIHKKGTGMDWLGSRAWKARWGVLSLARIAGHIVEVPILQIFWHPNSPSPSTVIHLDSAVVVPEDLEDTSKWNCHRFQILHVRKSVDDDTVQMTRFFSCPRYCRDAWCEAINQALLLHEKEKARVRKESGYTSLSPPRWRSSLGWATGDAHPSTAKAFPPVYDLPASGPRSPPRNLPRHEPSLIGESLLSPCFED